MPTVKQILLYLHWRFNTSTCSPRFLLNIRSALKWSVNPSYISVIDNILVSRFITGLFNLHPQPVRPLRDIWDVNQVLAYWDSQPVNDDLPSMFLTQKVILLLLISTMKRHSDILAMRVDNFYYQPNALVFPLLVYPKTYTINSTDELRHVVVCKFAENENICPLKAVLDYVKRTSLIRNSLSLFITTQSPYRAAASMTARRWILCALDQAGIDVNKYSAHSTRHASSSKAFFVGVSVDEVMSRAGWTCVSSFVSHYNLPINQESTAAARTNCAAPSPPLMPRWRRNVSVGSNIKNYRNATASKLLQRARDQVFRTAVRFNSQPFVAAPPKVPRLVLTKPVPTSMRSSVLHVKGSCKTTTPSKKIHSTTISTVPLFHDDSSTESASE